MNRKPLSFGKVLTCFSDKRYAEALKWINRWNNECLAQFLHHNPRALESIRELVFDAFWKQRLDDLRIPHDSMFRFIEQPGIKNADLVSGYLLFLLELKPKTAETSASDETCLFKPTDLLSFHLVRQRLHLMFLKEENLTAFSKVLSSLESFAKLQGAPGHLLLANGYMQLALRYQKLNSYTRCQDAFKMCWKYLHIAELTQDVSQAAINNAYFGKGLVLATPFALATIFDMKSYLRSIAGSKLLPMANQVGAEYAAHFMYDNLTKYHSFAVRT